MDSNTRKRMKADLENKIAQIKKHQKDEIKNGDIKTRELCLQGKI